VPLVKMPDGTVVQMPERGQLDAGTAAKLQAMIPKTAAPPQTNSSTATSKLGPWSSAAVRPVVQGLGGIVTALPDFATQVANLFPDWMMAGEPKIKSPGQALNETLDRYTTAPSDRSGKVAETISSMLVGGMAGPKMPTVPSAGPIARRLANEGVVTTPGQRAAERGGQLGRAGAFLEEKASNIHPSVRSARANAQEQWRTARLDEALKSAGAPSVPRGTMGRDALRYTYEQLQDRYDTVLSKMRGDLNTGFGQALAQVKQVGRNLDAPQRKTLNDIIDDQVIGKFTAQGKASGETIKEIEEKLRTEMEAHESGSYQDRKVAAALKQARAEMDKMLRQVNPKTYAEKEAVDKGYAQYKLSEKAAGIAPTKDGAYTPGQRLSAAKARDTSKDKGRFARGQVQGQQEAQEAQNVLGNVEPNSGTPAGLALLSALGGLGGGLAGTGHEGGALTSLLGLLAPMGIYNQPVLRALQNQAVRGGPETLSKLGVAGAAQQGTQ
jgi:hypothetical protein